MKEITCNNLEWLESSGSEKARDFLEHFCPRQVRFDPENGVFHICEKCAWRHSPTECEAYSKGLMELTDWLFERHKNEEE